MSELKFNTPCPCGKIHELSQCKSVVGKGTIDHLSIFAKSVCANKAFLFADVNTYPVAGDKICQILNDSDVSVTTYIFPDSHTEPDEKAVGSLVMHFDNSCDMIVGLGSGVMNDLGKILANLTGKPYVIVGTAPSMDGYASASSSMAMDGVKVSLNTMCPHLVIGDTDILKTAPLHMMKSGLGDMLAKYTALCEWRISHLLNDEYYCEAVAGEVRNSLKKCTDNASGLLSKDEKSIEAVFEGLIGCGSCMEYAGCSRPASGIEHYLSHVWDMRGLEFGTNIDLHGIQCAIGSLYSVKAFEELKKVVPDKEKALEYVQNFNFDKWSDELRAFIGEGAESMIALEEKEQKYNVQKHKQRLEKIMDNWDEILRIIDEELPSYTELEAILDLIEAPKKLEDIGLNSSILPMTFKSAKDIRDKYVLPRLVWDLGIIEEFAEKLN